MRYAIALMVVVLLAGFAQAAPTTRPLAEIRSADELEKQPAIDLPGGGTVKLGIGPLDPDLGPWRIVYAKFDGDAADRDIQIPGDAIQLGPLFVRCDWDDRPLADISKISIDRAKRAKSDEPERCIVPIGQAGKAVIRVMTGKGEDIAVLPIEVAKPIASPWRTFASRQRQPGQESFVVTDNGAAIIPRMASFGGAVMKRDQAAKPATHPADPLTLSLADGVFTIDSNVGPLMSWADENLLARWWVDGQPRMPTGKQKLQQQSMGRAVGQTKQFRVGFALPDDLADLKPGARIAVQLMYCSGGQQPAPDRHQHQLQQVMPGGNNDLLLSNRLEFVIPPK